MALSSRPRMLVELSVVTDQACKAIYLPQLLTFEREVTRQWFRRLPVVEAAIFKRTLVAYWRRQGLLNAQLLREYCVVGTEGRQGSQAGKQTPRSPLARTAARWAYAPRWDRRVTASTTLWPRAWPPRSSCRGWPHAAVPRADPQCASASTPARTAPRLDHHGQLVIRAPFLRAVSVATSHLSWAVGLISPVVG